jgi:hypothetical protein
MSSAMQSAALSAFSNLSLPQISYISFYALPGFTAHLSNSEQYVFGERGVASVIRLDKFMSRMHRLRRYSSRHRMSEPVSIENLRLKGRFAEETKGVEVNPSESYEIPTVQDEVNGATEYRTL